MFLRGTNPQLLLFAADEDYLRPSFCYHDEAEYKLSTPAEHQDLQYSVHVINISLGDPPRPVSKGLRDHSRRVSETTLGGSPRPEVWLGLPPRQT